MQVRSKEAFLSIWESIEDFNVEDRLGEIKVPTLVLIGGRDPIGAENQLRIAIGIPGAKVVFYEDESHGFLRYNIPRFVSELTFFINRLG